MLANGQALTSRYTIIQQLNKGGMGVIYEAFDTLLQARVVIKENLFEEETMRVAFQREAQLLANLHHPSLPYCIDLLSVGKLQYIVMEFIEGDDMATLMTKTQKPLPVETVNDWARQLLDVLEYLHSQTILHRDIKPANLKVNNGRVYLLDFGLAYGLSGEMNTVAGGKFNWKCHTRRYSPLEQLRCERTYPASDLYSLAATLYKLLTAAPPEDAERRFQSLLRGNADTLKDIRRYNPHVDEDVRRTIMQALSLNINQRPQSAREMRQMMFPEKVVQPKPNGAQKFMMAKLLAGILTLGMVSGFVLKPLGQNPADASDNQAWRCEGDVSNPQHALTPVEQAAPFTDEAERLQQSGKDEASSKKVEDALVIDSSNFYAHYLKGDLEWNDKAETAEFVAQIPEVQAHADMILGTVLSPRSMKEYVARAWAYYAKAELDKAIADANDALDLNPDSVAALMIRASARFNKIEKEIDENSARGILKDYDAVISLTPNYPQARVNRADIHLHLALRGDINLRPAHLEHARSDYEYAIGLKPRASTYSKLGKVNFMLGNMAASRSNFRDALEKNHAYYQAYIGLADIFLEEGDYRNAEINYQAANKINKTEYAFKKLGGIYQHLKQFWQAEASYRQALKLNQTDGESLKGLELALAALKESEKENLSGNKRAVLPLR